MQYQRPVLRQEQRLKMNPQLLQSIQLMALPLQDLRLKIQEELEKNPALEMLKEKTDLSIDEISSNEQKKDEYDFYENSSDPGYSTHYDQDASDAKQKFIEGALSRPDSLEDHLIWQLRLQPIDIKLLEIGELLIRNLDVNGFHIEDPKLLVSEDQFNDLNYMKKIIQGFDPVGVCTKDYKETLLVQIQLDPEAPEEMEYIYTEYFELIEKGKISELSKKTKFSENKIQKILSYLKSLNPFPGRPFSTEEARYVIPDVIVKDKEGIFTIILNDEEIPVLGVNSFFENVTESDSETQKELKKFVESKIKDARWFIRSINQRNETLLKITRAILEFQRDFFLKGPKYIVPLTLKDIAEVVSVHETTVSRISNSKYMQTEWGIFDIKYFFSNSISGSGSTGSRFSKEGVKQIIKEIIEKEGNEKTLSDQKISNILKDRGISIARRTVSKYRKELDILPSFNRN